MSTATLISITTLSSNPGATVALAFGQQIGNTFGATLVDMQSRVMEVTPRFNDWAGSLGVPLVSLGSASLGISTGSWPGNANTAAMYDSTSILIGSGSGVASGSLLGNANTQNTYLIPDDVHWNSPISTDNPETIQSADLVGWNFFPTPTPLLTVVTVSRDMTRFKKTYSSQRQQVRRIRIIKR